MKIVFDATALHHPSGRRGGIEGALWETFAPLRALDRDNHYLVCVPADAPVITPDRARLDATTAGEHSDLWRSSERWRWHRLPFNSDQKARRIVWQQFELPRLLRQTGADLLHSWNYVMPLGSPVPTILTVQDLIALDQPRFAKSANRAHYRALMPQSLKRAARVLVSTPAMRAAVKRRAPAADVRVIPLGIAPEFGAPIAPDSIENVRAKYDLPPQFLFFLGNFEPKKNLPNLLRALQLLPDAPPLVIAGGIAPWPQFDQLLRGVRQLGFVPRADLPALLSACEVFCFPSLCEGFGLPVVEALACGAPVVASRSVPLPDLERVALCPSPRDPRAIAGAIARLLSDEPWREKLRAKGRKYARQFSWPRAARATLDVYWEFDNPGLDFERFDQGEPGA